ncbi:isoleucine--tRNA ligase [Methanobacterium bryantii]|uniref:Isoleucine--tRNA ligase n=2 Tax=Methanobacterium TaxID=2160 RepID=A0A2A2H107_METBR|nr:isoleucine--tRNA ligase [Methanobacterium bryantii]PAV03078.1 isoleucine--tRNA ligase [Methanobacterium bryantii]
MPIKEAKRSYDTKLIEKDIQKFWNENSIYQKTDKLRENSPKFSFLDGPPYCSGKIHLGTAWNKTIKDTFLRFKSMSGFNLRRQAGWDTHGLPIEHKVEGLLGLKSKKEIETKIGIANFVEKCKEFAIENKALMTDQFKMLGIWMDWNNPYVTFDTKYMESCWWTLKKANEKDLLINDLRVITWCPRCETALALAEIDYENKEDPSIYVKFPLKESENGNEYVLVWTTTPWTLPANMAVCVHPDFDYAYVNVNGEVYIMAEALVSSLFEDQDYEILKTVKGSDLEGLEYQHPLIDEIPVQKEFTHKILPGEHVTLTEGTGCVHTAPGHGPDDFDIGKKYGLPIFCPVDEAGLFKKEAGKYEGEFVKEADPYIITDLDVHGLLFKEGIIDHRYGFCWRCKTPIIYLATQQWFLKVTDIKDKMLSELDHVEWVPEWAGESRFRNWVENARDWTISRQRYWGIPIPIWRCEDCGEITVIGSIDELKEKTVKGTLEGDFIHRPYVDEITIQCECGGDMNRVPDVLDVWIDSGVAGWAALHYPEEKEMFDEWFPYDFITEGHDQTRGWFYSQLGCGVISFDKAPYKKVLMHGFTLDEEGRKMSKSLGNVVAPEEVIEQYGADILRFYLLWGNKPWEDLKFTWDEIKNVQKMFNILWNVYVFSTTYMTIDNFNPTLYTEKDLKLRDEDRWITSRANSLAKEVTEALDSLYLHKATRAINHFILEDLSRWYVRLIRGRTWVEKEDPDKLGAYFTLYNALKLLIKTMAPITPHITEEIYQNLIKGVEEDAPESIHMEDWEFNEDLIDTELEENMDIVRDIIEACARGRDVARYKLRWPVSEIVVVSEDKKVLSAVESLKAVIMEQANTKEIIATDEFENLKIIAKPNLKTLGPRLRGDAPKVMKHLTEADGSEIKSILDAEGSYSVEVDGRSIELGVDDILFETELPENLVSADFDSGNVFINTEVTEEILSEAMSRELIRRVQDMRKDLDLDVEANIHVFVECDEGFKELIKPFFDFISNEVRAEKLSFEAQEGDYTKEWKIEDENLKITIKKT